MLRIVNFYSLFTAVLTHPLQNVYWISDQDDLFANHIKTMDTKRVLDMFASMYVSHPLGEVGMGTTEIDEEDRFDEDCASITDLVAGAAAELLTGLVREHPILQGPSRIPETLSRKTMLITDWLFSRRSALTKCAVVFSFVKPGHHRVGVWTIEDSAIVGPPELWLPSPPFSGAAGVA